VTGPVPSFGLGRLPRITFGAGTIADGGPTMKLCV
jgi:hypothetical protein